MTGSRSLLARVGLVFLFTSGLFAPAALGGSGITGYRWWPMGPNPAPGMFPGDAGGRVTSIAVNPMNKDDVWIGTAGGGVWHFDSGRKTWYAMSDDEASLAIGSIALAGCDPSKCTTIYAGTGENAFRRDTYYGAGLLVGTFDGTSVTWREPIINGRPTYDFTHGSIYNVVLDKDDSDQVLAIYITLSSGNTASASESTVTAPMAWPDCCYGIYKSTDNAVSWTKLSVAGLTTQRPTDLEMDQWHHNVLYAGFDGLGIFRSPDSGATWCPLNPQVPRPTGCSPTAGTGLPSVLHLASQPPNFDHVEIALDPTAGQSKLHLYASFGMCLDVFDADCAPGIYESKDGGDTWSTLTPGDRTAVQNWTDYLPPCPYGYSRYTHALTVDPGHPANLFVGATHLCKYDRSVSDFVTTDHNTVAPHTNYKGDPTQSDFIHLDHHAVVFATGDNQRVYDANDGGVAISTNGGTDWTPMNSRGLGAMEFQSISASTQTPDVFGGLQDNGALEWIGGYQWQVYAGPGDGGSSIMSPHLQKIGRYVTSNPPIYNDLDIRPLRSWNGENPMPDPCLYDLPCLFPSYDKNLDYSDRRSFYPPYLADPSGMQYFGTQRLWTSNDEATTWTPASPFLVNNASLQGAFPGSGTFPGVDSLTAIAFHPFNLHHVYVGTYTGKLFANENFPCAADFCWPGAQKLPPASPITRLAVEPYVAFYDKVYATMSGFFAGTHVFKSSDSGQNWGQTAAHPDLDGVPVNTIAIDPSTGMQNHLWIGTDKGVYRSDNGGSSWYRFSLGLPNVPVYELVIDNPRDRVIAATHGRGAYILTTPTIVHHTYYSPGGFHTLLATLGSGFGPGQRCTLRILRQDGSLCASGANDALGGTVGTDANGFLVSTRFGLYTELPLVSVCAQGRCLDSDAANCTVPGNPMASLEVDCGGQMVAESVTPPEDAPDPPSSVFGLIGVEGSAGGTLQFLPAVQSVDGSARLLCSVGVLFGSGDTAATVLQRASDAITGDGACQASGVVPLFIPPYLPEGGEDQFPRPARLALKAPGPGGVELVPGFAAAPGQATGLCLEATDIGKPGTSQLQGLRVRFTTPPGGASGGSLAVIEHSGLGLCSVQVPVPAGAQPADIAAAVAAMFQAAGVPGPNQTCPSDVNPRDLVARGDSITTALASGIDLCVNDAGVGVAMVPQEICFTDNDCNDNNPCTADVCNPTTEQCQSTPLPDGIQCDDQHACTVGNTCHAGSCGTPVVCNDGNLCTTDRCDPATGACVFQPVTCDDGNRCTTDSCDPASGQCAFAPAPAGTVCDDGDACTTADSCVVLPGTTVPICQGQAKCADGDPCSADLCDPVTGACSNPPIQCDDGNPCTLDSCNDGECTSVAVTGIACDDRDRCTTGGTCQTDPLTGAATCVSQPINCDDGDACTMDSCEPTTGGCMHSPIAEAEVPTGVLFTSASTFTWPGAGGAVFYNTYRGTIPQHMMASRPPAGPLYDQSCFEYGDAFGDGATNSTDTSAPPVGTGFYYLVSEETGCGESSIGSDSNGTPIPNTSPCSNPAPPTLNIVKSHSGNFTQGQTGATYTVVVFNSGPGPTIGTVTVTDVVPSGLTLVSMAGPGWSCPASPGNTCSRSDALAGGGASYPPITVTVNLAATASSPQVNQAGVSGGGSSSAFSSDSTTILPLAPTLSIAKTHTGHFYLGQPDATYTVTVSNTGNAPTSGTVTVTDTTPTGIAVTSMSGTGWTCNPAGCSRSDALAAGTSYPDITVAVSVTSPNSSSEVNQAIVSGGGSPAATANDTTLIDLPLLFLFKNHTGNFYQGQTNATYTLKVQSQFGPTLGTVTVTELTPAGLTLVSMAGTGWSCPATPGNVCTRSDVLASNAFYPDITVTVNVAPNAPSSALNHATISGGGSIGTGGAFDLTTIDPALPALAITKTHTGNFTQGQTGATYTVTVSNTGNAPTSGTITVTETVPSGLTLVSMAGTGWTCPSPGNSCSRSDALAAGASYPAITVTVNVSATATSPQVNQVSASQPGLPPANTSDSTNIDPGVPVLSVTKTHNGNFSQGQTNATYKVTVTNTGPVPTVGPVNVDDALPPGLTFVSISGTGWNCPPGIPHCDRGDPLPPGASYPVITVMVSVSPTAPSPQVNQVNVGGGGAPPMMASDSTTIIAAGVPSLTITKTHVGNFIQGQIGATYTLTVSNNIGAGTTTTSVAVQELPPSGLTPVSMSGTGWTCSPTNCNRTTTLAPGASYPPITVTVNVAATATSPVVNQARVLGGGSAPSTTTDPTVILVP